MSIILTHSLRNQQRLLPVETLKHTLRRAILLNLMVEAISITNSSGNLLHQLSREEVLCQMPTQNLDNPLKKSGLLLKTSKMYLITKLQPYKDLDGDGYATTKHQGCWSIARLTTKTHLQMLDLV